MHEVTIGMNKPSTNPAVKYYGKEIQRAPVVDSQSAICENINRSDQVRGQVRYGGLQYTETTPELRKKSMAIINYELKLPVSM